MNKMEHCPVRNELKILPGNWRSDEEPSSQHPRRRRGKTYEDKIPASLRTRGGKRK